MTNTRIAALIGDAAQARILAALMTGQALTAAELAKVAGIARQAVDAHLATLLDARLLAVEDQGRHRYFRLVDANVARQFESLTGVAYRAGTAGLRAGPREPALRHARTCYDHLAGDLGVLVFDGLEARDCLHSGTGELKLTERGRSFFADFGIDVEVLGRRPPCRACLDWSVRRHHLGGPAGAALLQRVLELGWARRAAGSRVIDFSPSGERALLDRFGTQRNVAPA
ncbi:MAG TPA: winged helix-turn-helix domain-containing protein [Rhodocyclaceae bacterium]